MDRLSLRWLFYYLTDGPRNRRKFFWIWQFEKINTTIQYVTPSTNNDLFIRCGVSKKLAWRNPDSVTFTLCAQSRDQDLSRHKWRWWILKISHSTFGTRLAQDTSNTSVCVQETIIRAHVARALLTPRPTPPLCFVTRRSIHRRSPALANYSDAIKHVHCRYYHPYQNVTCMLLLFLFLPHWKWDFSMTGSVGNETSLWPSLSVIIS